MLYLILLAIVSVHMAYGQETETGLRDNKTQCINQMVKWCNDMQYSQKGPGMSVMSLFYDTPTGYCRVLCVSDSDGHNCAQNGSPWFACTPNHTLTYKGQVLSDTSTGVGDDICKAANMALNELSIQNMSFNASTEDFQPFFEAMYNMQAQLSELQRKMSSFVPEFLNGFHRNFGFPELDSEEPRDTKQTSTEASNQIEKE